MNLERADNAGIWCAAGGKPPSTSVAIAMELIKSLLMAEASAQEPLTPDATTALVRRFSQASPLDLHHTSWPASQCLAPDVQSTLPASLVPGCACCICLTAQQQLHNCEGGAAVHHCSE